VVEGGLVEEEDLLVVQGRLKFNSSVAGFLRGGFNYYQK
jgi:hypothetical protein